MRLLKQSISKDGSGFVTLLPEDPEDMWSAYNLIRPVDKLKASAIRRVTLEGAAGSTSSQRVHADLTVKVTSSQFDAQASSLHVSGQICEETTIAKLGQFHTLDLELNRKFTIEKGEGWDSVAVQIVKDAIDVAKGASAWAVVMQEGLAHICALMGERTVLRQKVETGIPRKRTAGAGSGKESGHEKGLHRFYQTLCETLLRQIDMTENLPILLASPGFTAQGFYKYMMDYATKSANKPLLNQKANFLVVHSSSGYLHSLNEVLQSPAVMHSLQDTKYARESKAMDDFYDLLRNDDGRAWYGPNEVTRAVDKGAVGTGGGVLLISNKLFRSLDVNERKRWVALVDKVRDDTGGDVRILSSEHESGRRLDGLGGVAAILTFPLEDLDEDDADGD